MFNNSKYSKWYFNLIESRREMVRNCFVERHHIVPRCLGGKNDSTNLVGLTPREHYICHRLLLEMVDDSKQKRKMAYALMAMGMLNSKEKGLQRISSRQYETIRNICKEYYTGKNNPFYGKGHFGKDNPMSLPKNYKRFLNAVRSKEHRKKMSEIVSGENNPFFGKCHSRKTRKLLSKQRSQPITVLFNDGRTVKFDQYGELGIFLGKSTHLGSKLCKVIHKNLWKKYGIEEIIKHDKNSEECSKD